MKLKAYNEYFTILYHHLDCSHKINKHYYNQSAVFTSDSISLWLISWKGSTCSAFFCLMVHTALGKTGSASLLAATANWHISWLLQMTHRKKRTDEHSINYWFGFPNRSSMLFFLKGFLGIAWNRKWQVLQEVNQTGTSISHTYLPSFVYFHIKSVKMTVLVLYVFWVRVFILMIKQLICMCTVLHTYKFHQIAKKLQVIAEL